MSVTQKSEKTIQKVLVIKLGALGDFIQAMGPMAAIRKYHPNAHITLMTTEPFENFAKECGYFDEILIDERPKLTHIKSWMSLKKTLNDQNFDRVYDLQNNDRTGFYFRLLSPKPEWVGIAKGASHRNTSPKRTAGHAFDGHVQTLRLAGITDIEVDNLSWMKGDLSSFDLKKPFAILVPGSAPDRPEKRWATRHFGELANSLKEKDMQPVIIGTKSEADVCEEIASICTGALNLNDQTSLYQIAALGREAEVAIGNDTGPMHLIGATGCKSLVLFSKHSNPVKHAPKGPKVRVIQESELNNLTAETVLKAIL